MSLFVPTDAGLKRASDVLAADRLLNMKATHSMWEVIGEMIKIWSDKHPRKWQSYLYHLDDIKGTRKDKKFASTYDKVHGGYLRYTIDLPVPIYYMIRCVYNDEELPMDKAFFRKLGKKFPLFLIPEKQ